MGPDADAAAPVPANHMPVMAVEGLRQAHDGRNLNGPGAQPIATAIPPLPTAEMVRAAVGHPRSPSPTQAGNTHLLQVQVLPVPLPVPYPPGDPVPPTPGRGHIARAGRAGDSEGDHIWAPLPVANPQAAATAPPGVPRGPRYTVPVRTGSVLADAPIAAAATFKLVCTGASGASMQGLRGGAAVLVQPERAWRDGWPWRDALAAAAVLEVDGQGTLLTCSPGFTSITGYGQDSSCAGRGMS